jgi:hypothetical protein
MCCDLYLISSDNSVLLICNQACFLFMFLFQIYSLRSKKTILKMSVLARWVKSKILSVCFIVSFYSFGYDLPIYLSYVV